MAKVTFGKFDGRPADEGTAAVFADGVEVGWIERLLADAAPRTSGANIVRVGGYQLCVLDGPEAAGPLLPLDGRNFDKLAELKDAVRAAYTPKSETSHA